MSFKDISDAVVGLTNLVFGDIYVYTPSGSSSIPVQGIFENAWLEVEGVSTLKPVFRMRLSDLPAKPGKGDTIAVNSDNYKVMESKEDGHGGSTLILQKV